MIVTLGTDDRPRLETFRCADYSAWTKRVEHMIRDELGAILGDESRDVVVLGIVEDDRLCAVIA